MTEPLDARPLTGRARADRRPHALAEWRDLGGYAALARARAMAPAAVVEQVIQAALNGRGGAGFPAGRKWAFMPPPDGGPRHLVVNGDETEPGAFKDRFLMEALPHQILEGALIAAHATAATDVTVLVRDAYRPGIPPHGAAIAAVRAAGLAGAVALHLHASAGRYIVGEESALIAALEGERPVPRIRPPFPAVSGVHGRPTTVNNVKTIACLPVIFAEGAQWFRALSRTEEGGTKLYGVSGRVHRPGLFEAPMGTSARTLIAQAGGVAGTGELLCFQPGGGASGFLGPEHLDLPLDFASCASAGSMLGTGTLIVLDTSACPLGVLRAHLRFYARESCGWCPPCREGLPLARGVLDRLETAGATRRDLALLADIAAEARPRGRAFCDLMGGAMAPLASLLARYPERFEAHLDGGCPARAAA
jgi:NADH-quinone oxidoreductase subunit F